jgi:sugar phosphate isomerase/epimerase
MRTLTLGFLNCSEVPPHELVSLAGEAGFESVGIRITGRRVGDPYTPVIGNPAAIADIRTRLRDSGVRLSNVSAYHLYPDVSLRELAPLVDTAHELGARAIVASCYDPDHARFCDTVAAYADVAAQAGLRLAFELVPFSQAKTLGEVVSIVRTVARDNFGILVDPLHIVRSGAAPDELRGLPREWFVFAQLCDAPRHKPVGLDLPGEARTGRLDPGEGQLPIADILDALPPDLEIECEFPTVANLQLPPPARARQIREVAQRYLAQYDRARRSRSPSS